MRQRECWTEGGRLLKKWGLGLDYRCIYIYIYIGHFCNFGVPGFYPGRVSGRVSGFFDKIRTRPGPALGIFFLKTHTRPYS